jgi:hypothetical protein
MLLLKQCQFIYWNINQFNADNEGTCLIAGKKYYQICYFKISDVKDQFYDSFIRSGVVVIG